MAKIKPTLSANESMFFELLVRSYTSGVINESLGTMVIRFDKYGFKRSMIQRYLRKLFVLGFLVETGRGGKTGRVAIYKIKK